MRRLYTKKNKYSAHKTEVDGILFDSKTEANRYVFLKQQEVTGVISNLRRQVRYVVLPAIKHIETIQLKTKVKTVEKTDQLPIHYTADFVYVKNSTGEEIVEDVKGNKHIMSADVPLRFKLFFWKYRKKVHVVTKYNEEI